MCPGDGFGDVLVCLGMRAGVVKWVFNAGNTCVLWGFDDSFVGCGGALACAAGGGGARQGEAA